MRSLVNNENNSIKTIQNFEIDDDTMVLVVSDVHLGAEECKLELFKGFLEFTLKEKKNGNLNSLQVLIFLGDIFDFIMESLKDFGDFYENSEYKEFFDLLKKLKGKIKLVFSLGNHEIDTTGDYESKFEENKKIVIKEFNKQIHYKFLKKTNCYQYIFLDKEGLKLCDKLEYIKPKYSGNKKKQRKIALNGISINNGSYNCLITHGYQFDPSLELWAPFWRIGLKISYDPAKEFGDIVWNKIIKPFLLPFKEFTDTIFLSLENLKSFREYISNIRRSTIEELDFINEIKKKFLPKYEEINGAPELTHIIFGHTHDAHSPNAYPAPVKIANCGAWQQVNYPEFVEISTEGKIKLVKIKR